MPHGPFPPEYKHELTREDKQKGQRNAVKARRKNTQIRTALAQLVKAEIVGDELLEEVAKTLNLKKEDNAVADLLAKAAVVRMLREGGAADLEKLARIVGEDVKSENDISIRINCDD